MTLDILVVEDNEKFLADVKEEVGKRNYFNADYATNKQDALNLANGKLYAGILSDCFFPDFEGGEEKQNAIEMGGYALENNIPIVYCTSTYHHGAKTQEVCNYSRENGIPLVDANHEIGDGEANQKNFAGALNTLKGMIDYKDKTFGSGGEAYNCAKGLEDSHGAIAKIELVKYFMNKVRK